MKYPKLIKKDLKDNLFEYDGGDLWIRENVSFWDDQEICWNNDIVDFIRDSNTVKSFLWKINYTIPYAKQIDNLTPNQEYKVEKDNKFFSKNAEFTSSNLNIISDVLLFEPQLISDFINKLDGLGPNQEYKVKKDNKFFSKNVEFNSTNLNIISDVLLFEPKLISDFINKLDGLKKVNISINSMFISS